MIIRTLDDFALKQVHFYWTGKLQSLRIKWHGRSIKMWFNNSLERFSICQPVVWLAMYRTCTTSTMNFITFWCRKFSLSWLSHRRVIGNLDLKLELHLFGCCKPVNQTNLTPLVWNIGYICDILQQLWHTYAWNFKFNEYFWRWLGNMTVVFLFYT